MRKFTLSMGDNFRTRIRIGSPVYKKIPLPEK